MKELTEKAFWNEMARLAASRPIVIDRACGTAHPRYPELIYPLDYGYLQGTSATDGDGIDVWISSQNERALTGLLCSFDTIKHDAEIKLLLGCSESDVSIIQKFNRKYMRCLYIPRPTEAK